MWAGLKDDWAYKDFHFRDITDRKYRHLFLLLYWPVILTGYFIAQRVALKTGYTVIHCALDDIIPFCEVFIIPYFIWPTGQDMWPAQFPRDNVLTWLTGILYSLDINTNVCPSEHVQFIFGVTFAAQNSKRFSGKGWMIFFWTEALLIVVGVAFVKQHSVIDVAAAMPLILIGYYFSFYRKKPQ